MTSHSLPENESGSVWRSPLIKWIGAGVLWLALFPVLYPILAWHPISDPMPLRGVDMIETVVLIDQPGEYTLALAAFPPRSPFDQFTLAGRILGGKAASPLLDIREIELTLTPLGRPGATETRSGVMGKVEDSFPQILLGRVLFRVASLGEIKLKPGGYKLRVRFKTRDPDALQYLDGSVALLSPEYFASRHGDRVGGFSEEAIPLANFLLAIVVAALTLLLALRTLRTSIRSLARRHSGRFALANPGKRKLAFALPIAIATFWLAQSGPIRDGPVALAIAFGFLGATAYSVVGLTEWAGGNRFAAWAARWDRMPSALQLLLGGLVVSLLVTGLWLIANLVAGR